VDLQVKSQADRLINKFKAHVVAKDCTQIEGIDHKETFSHVVRFDSIRLFLALVAHLDLGLFWIDVKTNFLNGNLEEGIYMDQPIGFISNDQDDKVCHPKKSIYSFKQSSRS